MDFCPLVCCLLCYVSCSKQNSLIKCCTGCSACCIAPSINSAIPGRPHGRPAGVRCVQLDPATGCLIFGHTSQPPCGVRATQAVCRDVRQQRYQRAGVASAIGAAEQHKRKTCTGPLPESGLHKSPHKLASGTLSFNGWGCARNRRRACSCRSSLDPPGRAYLRLARGPGPVAASCVRVQRPAVCCARLMCWTTHTVGRLTRTSEMFTFSSL